ncbi:MAG: ABC transporter permease [Chloroflexi bacterium]|nr:ABC transporter permease [Chloroflexota bacterium]
MLLRNLLRRPTRTLLTLLGIAIGIAAIVTLVALSRGLVANYTQITSQSRSDVTIQAKQEPGQAITLGTGFDEGLLDKVRQMPEVKSASGMLYSLARVPGAPFFLVFGYEPDQPGIRKFKIKEGVSLAEYRGGQRGGKPMLLGSVAADKLNKRVGDTLKLEDTTFRIVGIYETGVAMEDAGGVVSLKDAQALAGMPRQVMYIGIQLYHPQRAEEFKERLARILPDDVEVAGTQVGNMMLEMLELLDIYAWVIAMIAALVGGVGMMNTMLMSVFERTREIGVLRAVGWKSRHVLAMILGESFLLSVVGGLVGLALGAGLTRLAANTPAMAGYASGKVPPTLIAQSLFTAVMLGLIGGFYPSWRASRLPPVEALRYDGGMSDGPKKLQVRIPSAMRNLARQRTRTVLTLVGVGIGIVSMVLVGSIGEGAVRGFNSMLATTEITAVERDQPDTSLSVIEERVLRRIEALPEVEYVTGVIISAVSTADAPMLLITARERTDPVMTPRILREGRLIQGPRECLLGFRAAESSSRRVGDRMVMLGTVFTVVGIVETGSPLEDNGAIISLHEAQKLLNKPNQVMAMQIKLKNPNKTDEMIARLSAEYPKLLFSKSAEFTENLPDMQNTEEAINAIYAMAVLVGSIALMNTMIMSVFERTREIGVLRAVGWSRNMVLKQILGESLALTLTSGVLGVALSYGLTKLMQNLPAMGIYRDMFIITPKVVGQVITSCLFLGVIGGLYPAWRATRFSPVEALRYE